MSAASDRPTSARMLSLSARPLAEVLVDVLRRKSLASDDAPPAGTHRGQLDLPLDEDVPEDGPPLNAVAALRPGDVAAAVLLGRALDADRSALAGLQDPDRVTIIEVPTPDLVSPIARLLRFDIIGADKVISAIELDAGKAAIEDGGSVVIFRDPSDGRPKKPSSTENIVASAVQRRCAILAVTNEAHRFLPPDLVRLADLTVQVPGFDGEAVGMVIEAVTGRRPPDVDDVVARAASLDALNLSVRADLGAERSLFRLRRVLGSADGQSSGPRLSELSGLGAAKEWGLRLAADLQDYASGKIDWDLVDRGCLLTGRPGTGKTTFARALALEAGVHFLATSYSEWQAHKEGHLGNVTQAIRNAFADARRNAPSILFIDEIDTIPPRGKGKWNDDWWRSITNCLLECLDGFERREGVVVIAACNGDPSKLDDALIRAGRLDRHIEIPLPDVPALIGIFRTHLRSDLAGTNLRKVALAARGRTGADVERFVRDARSAARREGRELSFGHLTDAVRGGQPDLPDFVRRRVAYHEAGHAVAGLSTGIAETVTLSIGPTGGFTRYDPGEMRAQTRSDVEHFIVYLLGGRAAEELVFGEPTAGAGGDEESDLARATWLALRLESAYGLGQSGLVWIPAKTISDFVFHRELEEAVRASLERASAVARTILIDNRAALDALAKALFEAGYLDGSEVGSILAKTPLVSRSPGSARHQPLADAPRPHRPDFTEADASGDDIKNTR